MKIHHAAIPPVVAGLEIHRHHVLEASAGTGKTFVLEHRFIDLLLRGDATISDILVVTFTERATEELRTRIRQKLEDLLALATSEAEQAVANEPSWKLDEAAVLTLKNALSQFHNVAIYTIHGFCHRVLSEMTWPEQRPRELVANHKDLFHEQFLLVVRQALGSPSELGQLLLAWTEQGSMERLANVLLKAFEQAGNLVPSERPEQLHDYVQTFLAELAQSDWEGLAKRSKLNHNTRSALEKGFAKLQAISSSWTSEHEWTLAHDVLEAVKSPSFGKVPQDFAAADALARVVDCAQNVSLVRAIAHLILPMLHERITEVSYVSGVWDFQSLIAQLAEASVVPEFAQTLRERYRFAMIDEFQDTDELQWQIFRNVYLANLDAGQAAEQQAFVTVVGDPKQAIYQFRGADLPTYKKAVRELIAHHAQMTSLIANYRSTEPMVGALNALFAAPTAFFPDLNNPQVEARSGRQFVATQDGNPVQPKPIVILSCDGVAPDAVSIRRFLGKSIAAHIAQWRESQPILKDRTGDLALTFSDVFVLTRSRAESLDMAGVLRRHGIPCTLYKHEGLFQSDQAREVIDLLAAISEPSDVQLRMVAWNTLFFDAELRDLPSLASSNPSNWHVSCFADWHLLAVNRQFSKLYVSILQTTQFLARHLLLDEDSMAAETALQILEDSFAQAEAQRLDLSELIRVLRRRAEQAASDLDDSNFWRHRAGDAVQIMTIHRAKGLEAGLVCLLGGFASAPRNESVYVVHDENDERQLLLGSLSTAHRASLDSEEEAETRRLYYVAVTRGVGQLVLPWLPELKESAPYACINQRLPELWRTMPEHVEVIAGTPIFRPVASLASSSHHDGPVDWQKILHDSPLPKALGGAHHWPMAPRVVSYTSLSQENQNSDSDDLVGEMADSAPEVPIDASLQSGEIGQGQGRGRTWGIYLHSIFEEIDLSLVRSADSFSSWFQSPAVSAFFARKADEHGRAESEIAVSAQVAWDNLQASCELDGASLRLAEVTHERREVEFFTAHGGSYAKGIIDWIFAHDGKWHWLDWKSDVLAGTHAGQVRDYVESHYRWQIKLYCNAVKKMLPPEAQPGSLIYAFARYGIIYARPMTAQDFVLPETLTGAMLRE